MGSASICICLFVGTTLSGLRGAGVYQDNNIFHAPEPVRYPRRHGRGHLKALVKADKVVVDEVKRQSMSMVIQFLGEIIGQPGKASHRHPHGQVMVLHMGGRDVGNIQVAFNPLFPRPNALSRVTVKKCCNML